MGRSEGAQFEVSGWGEVLGPAGSGMGGEWWELGWWGIITVDTYCLLHIPPAFLHVLVGALIFQHNYNRMP